MAGAAGVGADPGLAGAGRALSGWASRVAGAADDAAAVAGGEAAGQRVGLALVGVVGARHGAAAGVVAGGRGRPAAALVLRDVRDLVGDQLEAGLAVRIVGAGGEVDVVADGEGARRQLGCCCCCAIVGVQADARGVDAQLLGEALGQLLGQLRLAAGGGDELEGRGQRALIGIDAAVGVAIDLRRRVRRRGRRPRPAALAVEHPARIGQALLGRERRAGLPGGDFPGARAGAGTSGRTCVRRRFRLGGARQLARSGKRTLGALQLRVCLVAPSSHSRCRFTDRSFMHG